MSERAVVNINLSLGEIRVEGSESFVKEQIENLEQILNSIGASKRNFPPASQNPTNPESTEEDSGSEITSGDITGKLQVPEVFGEWLHSFKDKTSDQEKALIAAYFIQSKSDANEFKTSEVTKFLTDHGIKLSNASATLKQIEGKKLIFQTRKPSKISYKRVSQDGIKHLLTLRR
ncbi:hypothetical protein [Mangrovitalea sediminis]|uniref:hypothetical protein n=1 Tax=Mangrovitalea sediminis TaxID=1982043 RepID=UPI000BE55FD7|nr:hypothetical protein [Mangrovitalea sediminis]